MSQSISSCYRDGFSRCLIYGIMDLPALIVEKLLNFFFSPYGSHLSERALSNINNMLWKKGAESITSSGIGSLEAWCPSHPCPSHRQKKERKKDWCKLAASQSTHTSLEKACNRPREFSPSVCLQCILDSSYQEMTEMGNKSADISHYSTDSVYKTLDVSSFVK